MNGGVNDLLNPEQTRLVIGVIKDKVDNYAELLRHENAKPLVDQDTKLIYQLTKMYHEYDEILSEVQRVGV